MSRGTLDPARGSLTSATGLSPSPAGFPKTVPLSSCLLPAVLTPECSHPGLGSFLFARRYLGNRCFFLFLRVLRCFSSPGSPCMPMDSACSGRGLLCRVAPFRYPWLSGYLLLPTAFRSLSRLSSALSAQASALCSFLLDQSAVPSSSPACSVMPAVCGVPAALFSLLLLQEALAWMSVSLLFLFGFFLSV